MTTRSYDQMGMDRYHSMCKRDQCRARARRALASGNHAQANEWLKLAVYNADIMSDYEEEMTAHKEHVA